MLEKAPDAAESETSPRIRIKTVRSARRLADRREPLAEFASIHGDPGEHLAQLHDVVIRRTVKLEYAEITGGAQGVSRGHFIATKTWLPL